jgi:SAM-dependent methyltransferase
VCAVTSSQIGGDHNPCVGSVIAARNLMNNGLEDRIASAILAPEYESQRYIEDYLKPHMRRFAKTVNLLQRISAPGMRLIDIGSYGSLVPVFKDILGLEQITITEPCCADKPLSEESYLANARNGARYAFHVDRFDVEGYFPYRDGEFDIVIFTEVLEHLGLDPVGTLEEINRITRPGGWLLVSTPNCASAKSVIKILRGGNPNFYPVYTRQPSRDRHNREYVPWEVRQLLTLCGYEIEFFETADVYDEPANTILRMVKRALRIGKFLSLGLIQSADRGDTIFALARKTAGIQERYPSFLYV